MRARLDATDWRILKELQANGRITNVDLARKVGISPPPCLRRVRALEEAGIISGYFALLDEKSLDFQVIAFANVGLHSQSEPDLRAFENRVLAWPMVRECYMLSGETDFILKCVAPDLTAFQDFIINELTAAPNVASVKTTLVIRRVKFDPGVPITQLQQARRTGALRAQSTADLRQIGGGHSATLRSLPWNNGPQHTLSMDPRGGRRVTDDIRARMVAVLPRLRRFAYALTGSTEQGDDLVQETCLRALSRVERWQPGSRLDSWMYRIAQNIWLDRMRANKVRGEVVDVDVVEELPGLDGREVTESQLTLEEVDAALGRLPTEQRAVIALVCIEGVSYKEAAEITGVPIGTIMSRLARARQALHAILDEPATMRNARVAAKTGS